jgi:queuine tRNA-ribosyltransferase
VLLSTINLAYYQTLMTGMRTAIVARRFAAFREYIMEGWELGDSASALTEAGCFGKATP